jgi:hypothetical protein
MMAAEDEKWMLEDDVRTLSKAMEIVRDEKRLKAVQDFAKEKRAELEMVEDVSYLKKIGLK